MFNPLLHRVELLSTTCLVYCFTWLDPSPITCHYLPTVHCSTSLELAYHMLSQQPTTSHDWLSPTTCHCHQMSNTPQAWNSPTTSLSTTVHCFIWYKSPRLPLHIVGTLSFYISLLPPVHCFTSFELFPITCHCWQHSTVSHGWNFSMTWYCYQQFTLLTSLKLSPTTCHYYQQFIASQAWNYLLPSN